MAKCVAYFTDNDCGAGDKRLWPQLECEVWKRNNQRCTILALHLNGWLLEKIKGVSIFVLYPGQG